MHIDNTAYEFRRHKTYCENISQQMFLYIVSAYAEPKQTLRDIGASLMLSEYRATFGRGTATREAL